MERDWGTFQYLQHASEDYTDDDDDDDDDTLQHASENGDDNTDDDDVTLHHDQHHRDDDQGRRPNNEDRAAHRKVSCPWEGVRPVHIFTVRPMLLCIFRLYYLLSTFHFHRETIFFFEFSFPLFIVHRDPFFFQFFFFIIFVNISVKGFGWER